MPLDSDHPDVLAALARELGVVLRRRSEDAGMSVHALRRQRRRGTVVTFARGAYVPAGTVLGTEHAWLRLLLAGGTEAVLSGEVACHLHGLEPARRTAQPCVLVPHHRVEGRPHGSGLRRTRRPPYSLLARPEGTEAVWPVAPLPRAVADAVRESDVERSRSLVGAALSSGRVIARQLVHELESSRGRPGASPAVLADLRAGGVWSVPEGDVADLVATSSVLPPPELNTLLVDPAGKAVLRPDLLWWQAALAASVDSRQNHGEVEQWGETLARATTAEVRGLLVVHLAPAAVAQAPREHLIVLERHYLDRYGRAFVEGLERRPGVAPQLRAR